jgi:hypothetical protein
MLEEELLEDELTAEEDELDDEEPQLKLDDDDEEVGVLSPPFTREAESLSAEPVVLATFFPQALRTRRLKVKKDRYKPNCFFIKTPLFGLSDAGTMPKIVTLAC